MARASLVLRAVIGVIASASITILLPDTGQAADALEGERLARRVCSSCHSFVGDRPSSMAGAPAFSSIARSKKFKKGGAALLLRNHVKMPNFAFTAEQAEDVAAFIRTLGRPVR